MGITLGEQGFLYEAEEGMRHILRAARRGARDTNGAGDVFHGAYAYAVAQGWDTAQSGLFASVTAALSCTGLGREAIPTAGEVERLLEKRTAREMDELKWA